MSQQNATASQPITWHPQPLLSTASFRSFDSSRAISSSDAHVQQHPWQFTHLQARMHPGMVTKPSGNEASEKVSSMVAASLISYSLVCI